ncbi:MAG: 4Fe-4S dicluster domain-containing protein [Armatimonadetes bacterium]|nr:4Fe-4S dicluster domain-containing protein [Armatimonadota bacterium]
MATLEREIRFESDRDPEFAAQIRRMPGCENLNRCIQCATCSGICPLSTYMDMTPRRVIQLARDGFKADVLNCNTIWLCASCYQCQVECPKEIGITDVMYALKCKAIEAGIKPKQAAPQTLYREFYNLGTKNGRISEGALMVNTVIKTQPARFWSLKMLGLRLLRTGRFGWKIERMPQQSVLKAAIQATPPINGKESS